MPDPNRTAVRFAQSYGITLESIADAKLFDRPLCEFSKESLMLMLAYFAKEAGQLKEENLHQKFADMQKWFNLAKAGG